MVDSDSEFIDSPCLQKKWKVGQPNSKGMKESSMSATKSKKKFDLYRKFQSEWVAKEPWSEAVLGEDSIMHMV